MRLWIISKYASVPKFGYPTRHYFIAKSLANIDNNIIKLIGSRSLGFSQLPNFGFVNNLNVSDHNLDIVILNGPLIRLGFNFLRIYSWLVFELRLLYYIFFKKHEKPDFIIVSSLSILTFLSGIILKRKFHAKLILEVRDIWPLTLQINRNLSEKNIFIRFLKRLELIGYRNADLLIGTMPGFKRYINDYYSDIETKVLHLPMGFESSYFKNLLNSNESKFLIDNINPKKYFCVGYAGTLGLVNQVKLIISAATILREKKIIFVIIGSGTEKESLISYCNNNNLKNIIFFDKMSRFCVLQYINQFDLMLTPIPKNDRLYKYGVSPNKWIDYMYCEKPILATYHGFKSVIEESNCGWIIPPDDKNLLAEKILEISNLPKSALIEKGLNGKKYLINNLEYDNIAKYLYDELQCIKK